MLLYVIGGLAAGLLGFEVYRNQRKPYAVKQAEDVAAAQRAAIEKYLGFKRVNPKQKDVKNILDAHTMDIIAKVTHKAGSGGTTPGPSKPRLLQGDPMNTVTGKTYYVTLSLSVPAFMASRDTVVQEAANHGFVDIIASPTKPQGWPGGANGDWYIKARAARPSQFARHKGVTTLVEGFEQ